MTMKRSDNLYDVVRDRYRTLVETRVGGGNCGQTTHCESNETLSRDEKARLIGYSSEDLAAVPEGAQLGLGCGNPTSVATIKQGETILDLGSGAGFDCFLAARAVGDTGTVIGIDMTYEMLRQARVNAAGGGFQNVSFQVGQIEHLPLDSQSVDVILSNCVINLSPDKPQVFREAFRVLKRGGRLAISDIVATVALPEAIRNDTALKACCVAGAAVIDDLELMLTQAGFTNICIHQKDASKVIIREWIPGTPLEDYLVSANIEAVKPD